MSLTLDDALKEEIAEFRRKAREKSAHGNDLTR